MYIDRDKALASALPSVPFDLERGRLRFFAKAIGLADPVYSDLDAARRAGHRDLPAPPSFLGNSIELELPTPLRWLEDLGVDMTRTLHGEQAFTYHALAYAGDSLVLRRRIVDVWTKKNGTLEFVTKRTDVTRDGETLAEIDFVVAIRHPETGR